MPDTFEVPGTSRQMDFQPIPRAAGDFQQTLTAEEVTAVCRAALGRGTAITSARELGSGLFNNTYLIESGFNKRFILRAAPRETTAVFSHELRLLQREQAIEVPLRGALGDLVPRTLYYDFSRQVIDRDYVLQTFLEGVIWDEVQGELTEEANHYLWAQLAEMARAIHQTEGHTFGLPAPEPDFERQSDAVIALIEMMDDNLKALKLDGKSVTPFLEMVQAGRPYVDHLQRPRLGHGDLWPKNVLIDGLGPKPRITGLLDGERGYWGDPLGEWVFYFLDIPEVFWEVYGRPPDDAATRFRQVVYRGQFAVQLLLEADRFGWDAAPFHNTLEELTQTMARLVG